MLRKTTPLFAATFVAATWGAAACDDTFRAAKEEAREEAGHAVASAKEAATEAKKDVEQAAAKAEKEAREAARAAEQQVDKMDKNVADEIAEDD
jgi:hypothetical protein